MICLTLFWNFLMIGTLSFGGGYGMDLGWCGRWCWATAGSPRANS